MTDHNAAAELFVRLVDPVTGAAGLRADHTGRVAQLAASIRTREAGHSGAWRPAAQPLSDRWRFQRRQRHANRGGSAARSRNGGRRCFGAGGFPSRAREGAMMMSTTRIDSELAEIIELADEAVALVLEDRTAALAEGREPLTIWKLFGHMPRALAVAEVRLEHALRRAGVHGEA